MFSSLSAMVRGDAGLSSEDVQQIQAHVPYSEKEIRRMHKRFCRLDVDGTGKVSKKHFLAIPELAENPLCERILDSMDEDLSDSIDFEEFVKALALFAPGSNPEERLSMMFRAYDGDRDGFLTREELFEVLKLTVQGSMTDEQLRNVVQQTVHGADKDGDGKLSFVEFKRLCDPK